MAAAIGCRLFKTKNKRDFQLDQNYYRNLISGRAKGLPAMILRAALNGFSWFYKEATVIRNRLYDYKILRSRRADAPVISIGNLTTGGTGKTPLVIWLCNRLARKGIKTAVLTRGYKGDSDSADEPAMIVRQCKDIAVVVNPDRVEGAKEATQKNQARLLIMDDGFQHRKLKRNLDIVAIDATCPFGYDRILPAGLLRETKEGLKRAQAVVITRYDQASDQQIEKIVEQIKSLAPKSVIAKAVHNNPYAVMMKDRKIELETLRQKKIFAFCGVGNPKAFINRLKEYDFPLVGSKIFNDHHNYTEMDITEIYSQAKNAQANIVLATQKDWVKTALMWQKYDDIIFAYLAVVLDFIEGDDKIDALVDNVINSTKN